MKKYLLFTFIITTLFCFEAYAQPANNTCNNAITLAVTNGTCSSIPYTNAGANTSGNPATPACWAPNSMSHTVWFEFVATSTSVSVSTNIAQPGGITNTQLAAYSGNCGGLTSIGCNEDINTAGGVTHTSLQLHGLTVGNTYYLIVDGNGNTNGDFGICVEEILPIGPPLPINDCQTGQFLCDKSTVSISDGTGSPGLVQEQPSCFGAPGERASTWYTFTVGTSGTLCFDITPTATVDYDWAVFNTTNGCMGAEVDCNWSGSTTGGGVTGANGSGGTQNEPCLNVVAGQTYSILVDRFTASSSSGFALSFGGTATFAAPAPSFTNTTVCAGNATDFTNTSTGSNTYNWDFGDGATSSQENPSHTYAAAGNYDVSLLITTNPGGCQNIVTQTITVAAPPTVNAGNDVSICNGTCVDLGGSTNATGDVGPTTFTNGTTYAIPDNSNGGVSSTINVTGIDPTTIAAGVIESVCLNITHTFDADLDIFLECPDGTRIQLSTDNGGGGNNFTGTCFSPTAGAPITGGTAPFSGTYSPEDPFSDLDGCAANGTWTLFVRDDAGGDTGSIEDWSITLNSNTPAFEWTPTTNMTNSTTLTPNVCPAATTTYTLTANNPGGCTATDQVTVTMTAPPTPTFTAVADVCIGDAAPVLPTASNDAPAINGTWSPAVSTATAGTTTYTFTPNPGECGTTTTLDITVDPLTVPTFNAVAAVCQNAAAPVLPTSSTNVPAITGTWSPAVSTATAGTTTYTFTPDAGQCADQTTLDLEIYSLPVPTASSDSINCNGDTDGSVTVTGITNSPSGFPGGYGYNWTGPGGPYNNTQTPTGLGLGTYTVTVQDLTTTCTGQTTAEVFQPPVLATTITPAPPACVGATGSATANPTGGTGAYTYSWDTSPVQTTQTATNLTPGTTYTVTVTDHNNCPTTQTVNLAAGTTITAAFNIPDSSQCFDVNSYVLTNTGTTGVNYDWDFGDAGTSTLEDPTHAYGTPGTYTITQIVYQGTCGDTLQQVVTVDPMPVPTATADSVLCNGDATGSALVTSTTNAAGPFSYSWAPGGDVTVNPTGLSAGGYTVTVTDDNTTCSGSVAVTVFEPPVLAINPEGHTDPTCNGDANGNATANPTGGTTPYNYSWSPGGQTTQTATGLTAGTYVCTITDDNGCIITSTSVLVDPAGLVLSTGMTQANCGLADGTATVGVVSGGSGTFSYLWDAAAAGQTTATAGAVLAGTYSVTVTDDVTGCTKDTTVTVASTTGITVTANFLQDAQCNGAADGSAYPTIVGGTAPYSFSWNTTPAPLTDSILTAGVGTYTVTVTDAGGCTGSDVVSIGEPTPVVASITGSNDVSCFGLTDGDATASGAGGTGGTYNYLWDPTGQTTQTATGLDNGTYTVIVTDSNSCIDSVDVIIQDGLVVTANYTINDNQQCLTGNSFGFTNTGTTGGVTTFEWDFGDASPVSLQENPFYTFAGTGTYTVEQIIYSGVCSDTITQTLTVDPMPMPFATADSVNCFGESTGSIVLDSITNSVGGYDYLWDAAAGGQTTANATGLSQGTYTLTVTDQNTLCTGDVTVTVEEPTAVIATITASADESCLGAANGSATVSGSQGTGGYTYLWSPGGQTTATATGLAADTYTAYVYDDNLCVDSVQVVINSGAALTSSITGTDITCFGLTNGSIDFTVNGAPGAVTYAWTPSGSISEDPVGLAAGFHYVTATSGGCSVQDTIKLNEPSQLVAIEDSITDAVCAGNNDGIAYGSASGGTTPYTYLWDAAAGGQNTATATSLIAGNYTLTVTDSNNCQATEPFVIGEPAPLDANTGSFNAYCSVDQGSAWVQPTNGTAPYTLTWDSAGTIISTGAMTGTSDTLSGLFPGDYNVGLVDANGCKFGPVAVTVNPDPAGIASISAQTDVSCNGGSDGTAMVSLAGAFPGYTYQWDAAAGNQTTNPAVGLALGTYNVVVTDTFGCQMPTSVNIGEPTAVSFSLASNSKFCPDSCDGSAIATPSGGTAPYYYFWQDPNSQISQSATGLCSGYVTLIVNDTNGCSFTDSILISNPPKMILASTTDSSSCNQADRNAYVNVAANGIAPFTYEWSDGTNILSTDSSLVGVTAGTYYGFAYDSLGCSVIDTVTIYDLSAPQIDSVITADVLCFGQNNGTAEVYVSGGASPYTYSWNDGGNQATPIATNLIAAGYIVTVTDTNGCVISSPANVAEPDELLITTGGVNPSCTDSADGSVWVNAQGGITPYSYEWNSNAALSNDTIYNLVDLAGGYAITVTDSNGCFKTDNVVLVDPPLFTINVTGTDVSCQDGNNGVAVVAENNGIFPFTYQWNDASSQTTQTASGLVANTYNVVATDDAGCEANGSIVITEPDSLIITLDSVGHVSCNSGADGFITVSVVGGSGTYTYDWALSGATVSTLQNPIGLVAGLYIVTVTDTAGCSDQLNVDVTEPDPLGVTIIDFDAQCFGQNSGYAYADVSGGTAPYTYQWYDLALQQTDTAFNLLAGNYTLDVTDSLGCQVLATPFTIDQPDSLELTVSTVSSTCGGSNGSATVVAAGGTPLAGFPFYNYAWNTVPGQPNAVATGLSASPYQVIVTDANGCQDSIVANVTDFGSPTVVIDSITNVTCNGAADGLAYASVFGGTAPYQYIWDNANGDTTLTATGLDAQTYIIQVTDSNGCIASADTTISENAGVSVIVSSSQDVSCNGVSDGYAVAFGAGGTGAATLTYSWNTIPVQLNDTASNLAAGTYIVTATDLNNCSDTASIVITEPDALVIALDSLKDLTCYQSNDGYLDFSAVGGTLPYTWNSNAVGGPTLSGLAMGDYYMVVTDDKGCTDSTYHSITEPDELIIAEVTTASTCGNFNGSAEVTSVTGGTGPYFFSWNDPQNQQTALADTLLANTYTVVVMDVNGCSIDTAVTVVDTPGPVLDSVVVIDPLCNGGIDGSAQVYVSGNGPMTYDWTPTSQATALASGLTAGTYSVLVEDANSCPINVGGILVDEPDALTANITMPGTACYGQEIQLYGVGGGGTPFAAPQDPYDIIWLAPFNTTGTGPFFDTILTNFTYNIVVQDANGCILPWSEDITAGAPLTLSALGDTPCLGDTANVSATAGGGLVGGTYQYTWMVYDSLTGTATTPVGIVNPTTGSNVNIYTTDTTDYIVTVDDGCSRPATAGLTVNVLDTTVITMSVSDAGCPIPDYWSMGLEIEVLSGDTTNTYSWLFGDSQGMTSANDSVSHNYYNAGTYDVQVDVVSSNGCPSTFTYVDAVTIYQVPVADFERDPFVVTMLDPIYEFSDLSSVDVNGWNWDFGDLTTDLVNQNPTHTYQDTGFYPVTLIVTNGLCEDTITKIVQVKPDFLFLIPNTFTPQADGLNEIFMPGTMIGVSENDYNFYVFDRWGEQIYEGHDIEDGWDGTFKGSMSQTGVYVWLIKLKGIDGLSREYRGHVNLLR